MSEYDESREMTDAELEGVVAGGSAAAWFGIGAAWTVVSKLIRNGREERSNFNRQGVSGYARN